VAAILIQKVEIRSWIYQDYSPQGTCGNAEIVWQGIQKNEDPDVLNVESSRNLDGEAAQRPKGGQHHYAHTVLTNQDNQDTPPRFSKPSTLEMGP